MRRRILTSMIAVTAIAVAVLGVPSAIAVRRFYVSQAVLRLEREATQAARSVPDELATGSQPLTVPVSPAHIDFGVYDTTGTLLGGSGPAVADQPVVDALANQLRESRAGTHLVVAVPVIGDTKVVAVLRAAQPASVTDDPVHSAWAALLAVAAAAVAIAAVGARAQAGRLAKPVDHIRQAAVKLGAGDFALVVEPSGVPELDQTAAALISTAARLGRLIDRERNFGADASHQLRTPVTALRLAVETELASPRSDPSLALGEALASIETLEATIKDLLSLARDAPDDRAPLVIAELLDQLERRWHNSLAEVGRPLRVHATEPNPPVVASAQALSQALDVLVDNALRHGSGTVDVTARTLDRGFCIACTDEGPGVSAQTESIFQRHRSNANRSGIGLALARSLIEAEGGKLILEHPGPGPTFIILLPTNPTSTVHPKREPAEGSNDAD